MLSSVSLRLRRDLKKILHFLSPLLNYTSSASSYHSLVRIDIGEGGKRGREDRKWTRKEREKEREGDLDRSWERFLSPGRDPRSRGGGGGGGLGAGGGQFLVRARTASYVRSFPLNYFNPRASFLSSLVRMAGDTHGCGYFWG